MAEQKYKARSFDEGMDAPLGFASMPSWVPVGPNCYAIQLTGDCLEPELSDGDLVFCDPDVEPVPGDFVAIWWKEQTEIPHIKRLAFALPDRKFWDMEGDVTPILVAEMLNPKKQLRAPLNKVDRIHKVIYHKRMTQQGQGGAA